MTKSCDLEIIGNKCYMKLGNCSNEEFMRIIEYKSWLFKSWQTGIERKYFSYIYLNRENQKILWCYIGFASVLIRYLQGLGYLVNGKELFRSKEISVGNMYYKLYDFQQDAVNAWINNGCYGVIKMPTGCVTGDSVIFTDRGLITIKELYDKRYKNIKVMNYNGTEIQYNEIDNYYHYENKEVLFIRTKFGFELKCTPEHKLLSIDKDGLLKFIEAKDLKVRNSVPISYGYDCFGENVKMRWDEGQSSLIPNYKTEVGEIKTVHGKNIVYPYYMNEELAEFLGYYISEGNISSNIVQVTNTAKIINSRMEYLFKKLFNLDYEVRIDKRQENEDYGRYVNSTSVIKFLSMMNLDGKSREKQVPNEIMKSSKIVHISFLRALYSGDGYIEKEKKDVGYSSMSEPLCKQIQLMLLNLGIFSTLTKKDSYCYEKYCGKVYMVTIYGNNVLKFRDIIGFTLEYRKDSLNEICKEIENTDRWTVMVIPNIHLRIKELDDIARKSKYIYVKHKCDIYSYSKFLELYGFKGANMWCDGRRFPSKKLLKRILDMYSNVPEVLESNAYKYLMSLCELNVEYDLIECIEKMENQNVYDLTIKNIPNYVANGFVVHNSGKTITSCEIIRRMGVKTIVCIHTSDLLINAWFNTLVEQFGESIKSKIGIIGGGLTKNDRKKMRIISDISYESNVRGDIVIATAQSLLNNLDKISNERFGLLVWDETHHVSAEQFNKVASSVRAPYRLGVSASINRPDGTSPLIYGLMGDICYRISIKELIRKGILVEPIFNSVVINDGKIQHDVACCGLAKLDLARYVKKMSASSVVKKNYILKLAKSLTANNKKFIMYSDFVVDNGNGVFTRDYYVRALNDMGIRVIGVSADMSGSERSKVFNMLENNKLDGLIFGRLGSEGVNIPKVDSVIMNNATKSTILFPQRCGRAFRTVKTDINKKNAFVYEIILDTPMELKWSNDCFYEYEQEGYVKEKIYIN